MTDKRRYAELEQADFEKKNALTALQESEERFRRLVQNLPGTAYQFVLTPDGEFRFEYMGDNCEALFGYLAGEIMADADLVFDLISEPDADRVREAIQDSAATMQPYTVDHRIVKKTGETVWVHAASTPRRLPDGGILWDGILIDVTARKRAREDFANLFNMSLDMICIADINTSTFLKVNPAFTTVLGYSSQELLDQPFGMFIHPEDRASTEAVVEEKLKKGAKIINFENRYRCRDGRYRWLSWVSHPNPDEGVTYAIARDITDQKRNEAALKKSKALLDATGRMARVGGWELDVETMEVTWTEETYRIHELPLDYKPPLQEAIDFFHPDDRERLAAAVRHAIDAGEPYDMEVRFITAGGRHLWTRTICRPEVVDGRTVRLKGVFQDITDRKHAEEALQKRESMLERIFEILPVGLWFADKAGTLLRGNPAGVKIWGAEPRVPISEYSVFRAWRLPSRQPIAAHEWALAKTIRDGVTILDELLEIEAFDGKRKTILNYTAPILDEQGNVDGAIVVNLDVTERTALEARLHQSQKMESIGRLAGGVAHDFNNMLGVILGRAEMAMEQVLSGSPLHNDLEEIRKAASRSADLTRQLLAFARKQTIAPRVLDLNGTVSGMLKMLRRLIGEDIDLAWMPGDGVWPVRMDPSQVDQILVNLCVNARQAISGLGRVTIETANVTFDADYCAANEGLTPGMYVMLAVSDDGCGMDEETMSRIYEPFFTTSDLGKGTGLGLSMVYGIVKQNDGLINVYSETGCGTTFRIYLPRDDADAAPEAERISSPPVESGHETVLLVEDEQAILKMAVMMLERLGYTVLSAAGPGEAMRIAESYPGKIDLLMTDVVMPGMNGRDLNEHLRSIFPDLKCLFMSGYTANVIAHHGILDEGVHFIQKPFPTKKLASAVLAALKKPKVHRSGDDTA